jgi:hypothetical protein
MTLPFPLLTITLILLSFPVLGLKKWDPIYGGVSYSNPPLLKIGVSCNKDDNCTSYSAVAFYARNALLKTSHNSRLISPQE